MKNCTKIILKAPMLIAFVLLNTAVHAEETLQLDGTKSSIQFVGSKPDGKHNGGFAKISGTLSVEGENIKAVTLNIDATSIYSDDPKLTAHLKSPDFFHVKRFPTTTFKSIGFESGKLVGDLTIHGVSKKTTISLKISGTKSAVQIDSQFTIKRNDFGMNYGAGKINNEVPITAKLVFVK